MAAGGEGDRCRWRGGGFSRALLLLLQSCLSTLADFSGSTHCPYHNVSISEGSPGMILANVSSCPNVCLFHKSSSSDPDEVILAITGGKLGVYNSTNKKHFYLQGNDLFINNTNKRLAGEYQLEDLLRKNCFHRVFLSVLDPWNCPSANLSIPEGSSGMIIPNNILNHSNSLALNKNHHSSSSWEHILSIAKRHLNHSVGTYEEHFYISDSGLSVKNAYEGLAGEYQLVYQQNTGRSCVYQFFLNIPVSGRRHDYAYGALGLAIFLVLCFAMYLCWKRRDKDTAQLGGGLANGTLPPGSPEVQESRADPPRRENGNSFPHECDPQTNALLP